IVAFLQSYWHQKALAERQVVEARLATELVEARLAALQSRLEPHFLFNALNSAVMLVRDGNRERAIDVLVQLASLLRTVLHGPDGPRLVTLREELEFVERYLAIEKARFEDQLKVTIAVD